MATPLVTAIINKAGNTIYRKAGRFISKSTFDRESRRIPAGFKRGGQLLSKFTGAENSIARQMMAEFGPPLNGGNWVARVRMSAEKFTNMLADANELE